MSELTIVVTGTLESMSRNEAEARISEKGWTASGVVSSNTSYVVAGEKAGSKLCKAISLGVPILTEQEFINLLETS